MKICACGCGTELKNEKNTFIRGHSNRSELVKQKKRQKCLQKYGVTNPSQLDSVKDKKKTTCLEHYGSTHYMKSQLGKDAVKTTIQARYGVDNIFQHEETKKKIHEKWMNKKEDIVKKIVNTNKRQFYNNLINGVRLNNKFIPLFTQKEFIGVGKIKYRFRCLKCGSVCDSDLDDGKLPRCLICHPFITSGGQSKIEYDLISFLRKYEPDLIVHDRKTVYPLELDIFIPSKNLAIELDSLYWHSELNGKHKNYHKYKTDICKNKNIRLIHIFDDEWLNKPKIVKARLKYILGKNKYKFGARECVIKEISTGIKNQFLNKYHIQGKDRSSIKLGAYYKNRLVSVMTFAQLRKALGSNTKLDHYELSRFCTIKNFSISGVANKLFKVFCEQYKPIEVITYADLRWNTGNLYQNLGFMLKHVSRPSYWYTKDYTNRIHRFNFRKDLLREKLVQFDPNLSEWNNMKNNGYDRIWDCGNLVFVYKS